MTNVGGMQRVAMELCEQFELHDEIELTRLVLHTPWKGVYYRAVPFLLSLLKRLPERAKGQDVILFSSITTALPLMCIGRRLARQGVRLVSIAHGLDVTMPNSAYQFAVRRTLPWLDVVLPVSRATERECKIRGARASRVVPNGVDLARMDGEQGPLPERLPEGARLLVSVGRQVKRKGFAWFIRNVMPRLDPSIHYWLAGDGPERDAIEQAIRAAQLGSRVKVLGLVDDAVLRALFKRAELLVMPNIVVQGDMEGFGIVMIEAAAAGVPALAADLEGIHDVVLHEQTGWLEPSGDADAFVSRVNSLEPRAIERAGQAASNRVRSELSWQAVTSRYIEALQTRPVA
ncbi:MAG: glycosyltransferase family 4 protein [Myxococcota bacterium]